MISDHWHISQIYIFVGTHQIVFVGFHPSRFELDGSHEQNVVLDHVKPTFADAAQPQMAMKIDPIENHG
jgi:hypothetical protein